MNHFDMPITDPHLAGVAAEDEPTIAVRHFALLNSDGDLDSIIVSATPLTQTQFQGMVDQAWQKYEIIAENLGQEQVGDVPESEVEAFVQGGLAGLLCAMFPGFGFSTIPCVTARFS